MDNGLCVAVTHTQGIRQFGQGRPHVQIAGVPSLRNAEGLHYFASDCQVFFQYATRRQRDRDRSHSSSGNCRPAGGGELELERALMFSFASALNVSSRSY